MVSIVSDTEFLAELSVHKKILVKYYTDWCGSCRMFRPKFIRLSEDQNYNNIRFLDVNAENNAVARNMARVTHFPSFAIFLNGEFIDSVASSREEIVVELLNKLLLL
jgi:thioredoxin 1